MASNAVIDSLLLNLKQMRFAFDETPGIFKVDRENTGRYREYTVNEFLTSYLTNNFRITKGNIFSTTSNSQNIDCVVLAPNHPTLSPPGREIILAEGVYAAVEVKPNIQNRNEFDRGLIQCKSVKNLNRIWTLSDRYFNKPIPDFLKKIPFVLFAKDSPSEQTLVEIIDSKLKSAEFTVDKLPDIIMTLDKGMYLITPDISETPAGHILIEQDSENAKASLFHFTSDSTEKDLALFLWHFLCFQPAYEQFEEQILFHYLKDLTEYQVSSWIFRY
jgi:hypothetical protein